MTVTWAYIFEHPGTDPDADRTTIDRSGQQTLLVPVPSAEVAPQVALQLVADHNVTLIEVCGGMTRADAAKVAEAVGPEVAVGHVTFTVDAVPAVAAYAAAFEASVDDS
jgi:hypothetical protein